MTNIFLIFFIAFLLLNNIGFAKDVSNNTIIECNNNIDRYSAKENKLLKDDTFYSKFTIEVDSTSKDVTFLSSGEEIKGMLLNRDSNLAIFTAYIKKEDKSYLFFYFFNNKTIIFADISNLSEINTIDDMIKLGNFYTSICSYKIAKK